MPPVDVGMLTEPTSALTSLEEKQKKALTGEAIIGGLVPTKIIQEITGITPDSFQFINGKTEVTLKTASGAVVCFSLSIQQQLLLMSAAANCMTENLAQFLDVIGV